MSQLRNWPFLLSLWERLEYPGKWRDGKWDGGCKSRRGSAVMPPVGQVWVCVCFSVHIDTAQRRFGTHAQTETPPLASICLQSGDECCEALSQGLQHGTCVIRPCSAPLPHTPADTKANHGSISTPHPSAWGPSGFAADLSIAFLVSQHRRLAACSSLSSSTQAFRWASRSFQHWLTHSLVLTQAHTHTHT